MAEGWIPSAAAAFAIAGVGALYSEVTTNKALVSALESKINSSESRFGRVMPIILHVPTVKAQIETVIPEVLAIQDRNRDVRERVSRLEALSERTCK